MATIVLLLVFGLQVQATFACEMTEHNGAAENCCCEDSTRHPNDIGNNVGEKSSCCEFSQDLVVKGSDPEQNNEPVAPPKATEIKSPPVLLAVATLWLNQPSITSKLPNRETADSSFFSPGRLTYLTTQRLRI